MNTSKQTSTVLRTSSDNPLPELLETLATRQFPYGRYSNNWIPCLYVAQSNDHVRTVINAFPHEGCMYISGMAMLTGYRFDRIIVWEPNDRLMESINFRDQWQRYVNEALRTALNVGHIGELFVV